MKAIMISIQPKYVADILNGKKTLEIRKTLPKCDLPIDVYIYCTKGKPNLWLPYEYDCFELDEASRPYLSDKPILDIDTKLNGKVVAKFTLNKVEEIEHRLLERHFTKTISDKELLEKSCLTHEEMHDYLRCNIGYAWHIDNLVVFDKPKELGEFKHICPNVLCYQCKYGSKEIDLALPICKRQLTRAPQSWQFIEV